MLYGTFFSSKVKSALCENGPEIKTKPNTMKNEDEVVTERERERESRTVSENIRSANGSLDSNFERHLRRMMMK
jgi:hypothetical protein